MTMRKKSHSFWGAIRWHQEEEGVFSVTPLHLECRWLNITARQIRIKWANVYMKVECYYIPQVPLCHKVIQPRLWEAQRTSRDHQFYHDRHFFTLLPKDMPYMQSPVKTWEIRSSFNSMLRSAHSLNDTPRVFPSNLTTKDCMLHIKTNPSLFHYSILVPLLTFLTKTSV